MLKIPQVEPTWAAATAPEAALSAPAWARAWANGAGSTHDIDGMTVSVSTGDFATLVSVAAPQMRLGDGQAFQQHTIQVYGAVRDALDATSHRHIVRLWNQIPGIHDRMDGACDRYMEFNAARFAVLSKWFGGAPGIAESAAAASGIGHQGSELIVHALAMNQPGTPIDNPLQVPAYRYSKRYGPLPPCFARATRVSQPVDALLLAGTAAITGEESRHPGDLAAQFELTLRNLAMLIRTGGSKVAGREELLRRIEDVRIYYAKAANAEQVEMLASAAFAGAVELIRADLCRADLLVEIEGVARI